MNETKCASCLHVVSEELLLGLLLGTAGGITSVVAAHVWVLYSIA